MFKEANSNFIILEGDNRVGGRINTVEMKGSKDLKNQVFVDAGAQWIHGRNNELYQLAEEYKLIRSELSEEAEGEYVNENGEKLDESFVKKVDFTFGRILEECEDFVKYKLDKKFKFPVSLEEHVNLKFKEFVDKLTSDEEKKEALQLLDWHRRFVRNFTLNRNCFIIYFNLALVANH